MIEVMILGVLVALIKIADDAKAVVAGFMPAWDTYPPPNRSIWVKDEWKKDLKTRKQGENHESGKSDV